MNKGKAETERYLSLLPLLLLGVFNFMSEQHE